MAPPYLRLKTDDATPNWLRFEIQPATNPDPANFPLGGLWALARDLRPAGPTWLRFANLGGASNMHNNAQRCTPIEPNWLRFEIQPRDQSLSTKSLLSGLRDFARDLRAGFVSKIQPRDHRYPPNLFLAGFATLRETSPLPDPLGFVLQISPERRICTTMPNDAHPSNRIGFVPQFQTPQLYERLCERPRRDSRAFPQNPPRHFSHIAGPARIPAKG